MATPGRCPLHLYSRGIVSSALNFTRCEYKIRSYQGSLSVSTVSKRKTSIATRSRILNAAEHLLKERGVDTTRMEDIAHEAGISRRAIYLHFATRTDLFLALVAWIDEREGLPALKAHVLEAPDAIQAVNRAVVMQAKHNPHIDRIAAVLEAAQARDAAAAAAWQDRLQDRYEGCLALSLWLQRDGLLVEGWSVVEATDFLWSMTSLRVWRDLVEVRGWSAEAYTARLQGLLQSMLVRPQSSST
jgi:AcrR family transcriptional regulator